MTVGARFVAAQFRFAAGPRRLTCSVHASILHEPRAEPRFLAAVTAFVMVNRQQGRFHALLTEINQLAGSEIHEYTSVGSLMKSTE